MKSIEIRSEQLYSPDRAKAFCEICAGFPFDIDVISGANAYDGKSFLGVMNIVGTDVTDWIEINVLTDDLNSTEEFINKLDTWME